MHSRGRVPYVIVYVENLEASERFYSGRLGLKLREFPLASDLGGHGRALSIQGTTLVLVQREGGAQYFHDERLQGDQGPAVGHCYPSFEVGDLAQFHQDATEAGVTCLQSPSDDRFGNLAIYRDPDGLLFSVIQPHPHPDSHGIALSGGGAYGAFELGVLRVLASDSRFALADPASRGPNVVTGTSVGAFNAAVLACGVGEGKPFRQIVEEMAEVWLRRVAGGLHDNGVFRVRGDIFRKPSVAETLSDAAFLTRDIFSRMAYAVTPPPVPSRLLQMIDVSSLFSVEPLRKLVEENINWEALEKSRCQLQIATTDWTAGQVRIFAHSKHPTKHEEAMTRDNYRDSVLASTAIPGIFQPVKVDCLSAKGGREERLFVDGGLVMNSPLNPAIDAGASIIHLICVNPDVRTLAFSPLSSTLDVLERSLVTTVAGNIASDLERARLVNSIAGIVRRRHSDEFYRPVTIHRYHPAKEVLGGLAGILDFSPEHLQALIADGERAGREHDCEREACVLPEHW